MQVRLKKYTNPHNYKLGFPEEIITEDNGKPLTIKTALKIAKERISEVRGTNKFLGFKIFDNHGQLKHKLPSI